MKTFFYDKRIISVIRSDLILDVVVAAFELFLVFLAFSHFDFESYAVLVTFFLLACFVFSAIDIVRTYKTMTNLVNEKLEITDCGIKIYYYDDIVITQSYRFVEIPWSNVNYAEPTTAKDFWKGFGFINFFIKKAEYSTILIHANSGTYHVFIENRDEAIQIINKNGDKPLYM